ncbi:MAG: hypothetical protein AAF483_05255 [Planctomycetota bacterium]
MSMPFHKCTTWLLRIIGFSICLAFFPILMPLGTMQQIHAWLGLGDAPDQPIFEYLARSTSLMYFVHGCTLLVCSSDIQRFMPLIKTLAGLNLFVGFVLIGTDLMAGMPSYWTAAEGPPIVLGGILLGWLAHRSKREAEVASNANG